LQLGFPGLLFYGEGLDFGKTAQLRGALAAAALQGGKPGLAAPAATVYRC